MTPELMQWLVPIASAVGGYFLRHWNILPATPVAPVVPVPAPTPQLPGGVSPVQLKELIDLMQKLLAARVS